MRIPVLAVVLLCAAVFAPPVSAQMGAQPGMHNSQAAMQHGTMMMTNDQMMRNVDQMMTHAQSMMHDLATMQMAMQAHAQHNPMVTTMQGMLDHMKEMHGQLHDMMHDPSLMKNHDVMKGFQDACRNLEHMADSYQNMSKNLMTIMQASKPAK